MTGRLGTGTGGTGHGTRHELSTGTGRLGTAQVDWAQTRARADWARTKHDTSGLGTNTGTSGLCPNVMGTH